MDMIVNRLSEIELAASRIMEAAALEKKGPRTTVSGKHQSL